MSMQDRTTSGQVSVNNSPQLLLREPQLRSRERAGEMNLAGPTLLAVSVVDSLLSLLKGVGPYRSRAHPFRRTVVPYLHNLDLFLSRIAIHCCPSR